MFLNEGEVRQRGYSSVQDLETRRLGFDQLAEGAEKLDSMIGGRESSKRLFSSIRRIAPYKSTVLIEGESGTGKELIALAMHRLGPCPEGPFVSFNCSNVVENLAESQLFGHVRGAFTDAREESQGYFRAADRGTLFLDEIGELPLKLQPKLLRVHWRAAGALDHTDRATKPTEGVGTENLIRGDGPVGL